MPLLYAWDRQGRRGPGSTVEVLAGVVASVTLAVVAGVAWATGVQGQALAGLLAAGLASIGVLYAYLGGVRGWQRFGTGLVVGLAVGGLIAVACAVVVALSIAQAVGHGLTH